MELGAGHWALRVYRFEPGFLSLQKKAGGHCIVGLLRWLGLRITVMETEAQ